MALYLQLGFHVPSMTLSPNHALQRTAGVRSGFKTHLLGPPSLSFALGDITRL